MIGIFLPPKKFFPEKLLGYQKKCHGTINLFFTALSILIRTILTLLIENKNFNWKILRITQNLNYFIIKLDKEDYFKIIFLKTQNNNDKQHYSHVNLYFL